VISRNVKIAAKGEVLCVSEELGYAPLKPGEVLIRNEASLVSSGTELSRVFGLKKNLSYPIYPGYASIGRVEETAGEMSGPVNLKQGDRVLFSGAHR
jgi:D-arabinose 1-dehydrogenase-like Zn-dependent alcohol dehydrogenase